MCPNIFWSGIKVFKNEKRTIIWENFKLKVSKVLRWAIIYIYPRNTLTQINFFSKKDIFPKKLRAYLIQLYCQGYLGSISKGLPKNWFPTAMSICQDNWHCHFALPMTGLPTDLPAYHIIFRFSGNVSFLKKCQKCGNWILDYLGFEDPIIIQYRGEQVLRLLLYYTINTPQCCGRRATPTCFCCIKKAKKKQHFLIDFWGLFGYWIIRYRGEQVLRLLLYSSNDSLVLSSEHQW